METDSAEETKEKEEPKPEKVEKDLVSICLLIIKFILAVNKFSFQDIYKILRFNNSPSSLLL